jgi:hypothetical protein
LHKAICQALYLFATSQLYFQYVASTERGGWEPDEEDHIQDLDPTATAIFLTSLCYMAYAVTKSSLWARSYRKAEKEGWNMELDPLVLLCFFVRHQS